MTSLVDPSIHVILLDIEGTTTPIDFVYKVLFPYARSHASGFLLQHGSSQQVLDDLDGLRREHLEDTRQGTNPPALGNPRDPRSYRAYLEWLIERDRKSTPLKSLEGKMWAQGYTSGELRSQVFSDVPPALKRWQAQQRHIAMFSSGSVMAQKLLFTHTAEGDLTKFLSAYFDTTVGAKTGPASYLKIARTMQRSPAEMVFISDVVRELDAADTAGVSTLLCERPGNHPQPAHRFNVIRSFDEVFPEDRSVVLPETSP